MQRHFWRVRAAVGVLSLLALAACRGNAPAQTTEKAAPAGPQTVEVVKVVEQPLNVTLSLPGELTPYQTVALYSRVTGFVKTHHGGSRFARPRGPAAGHARGAGTRRAEGQRRNRSCRAPRRNSAAIRAKADANASTYEKLKAASATPGVVAGNDVVLAQKTVEADQSQIAAAHAERRSRAPSARSRSATWKGISGSPPRSAAS